MEKYKIIKILGDGAFGTVYKAVNLKTHEIIAIKKMKSKYASWNQCLDLRQIKSLRKLSHPCIIKLKEVLLVAEQLYMVFEYLEQNIYEIYSKMKTDGGRFTQKQIKNILFQIASALANMHKNGFFHRDLKPQNLLIFDKIVKICDFGLAREIRSRPPFTEYVSTRWYRAPELLLRSTNYNSPVDVFALGCIMAELYNLAPLFPGNNQIDQLNKVVKVLGTPDRADWPQGYKLAQQMKYNFPQEVGVSLSELIPMASPQAIELIDAMLRYSSRKRLTMTEILRHEYFKGMTLPEEISEVPKEIIFQEKPVGKILDTSKEDQNIQKFRATKQKFRQTRRHDAFQSNPFRMIEKNYNKGKIEESNEDIDTIIAELQAKKMKKIEKFQIKQVKIPKVSLVRQKFYTQPEEEKRDRDNSFSRIEEKEENKYRNKVEKYQNLELKKYHSNHYEGIKKDSNQKNIFAYNFQPMSLPYLLPGSVERSRESNLPPRNQIKFSSNLSKQDRDKISKPQSLSPLIIPFRY